MSMGKPIAKKARDVQKHGRRGDTVLAHISPKEAALLKSMGGSGTVNPKTGLLEFYDADGRGNAADPGNPTGGDYGGGGDASSISDAIAAGFGPEAAGWSSPDPGMFGSFGEGLGQRATSPGVMSAAGALLGSAFGPFGASIGAPLGAMLAGQMNKSQEPASVMSILGSMAPPVGIGMALNSMMQAFGAKPEAPGAVAARTGFADFNDPDSNVSPASFGGPSSGIQTADSVLSGMQSMPSLTRKELYGNMRFAKGGFINSLAKKGRHGDNAIMHVSKSELKDMNRLVPGGLTKNPKTGLPEAFKLKDFLRYAAPVAAFGLPIASEAMFGGTPGGFLADLVGLGGSKIAGGIGDALVGAGIGALARDPLGGALAGAGGNIARGDILGLFGGAGSAPAGGLNVGNQAISLNGNVTPNVGAPAPSGSWIDRNSGLLGAGMGALALAGASMPNSSEENNTANTQTRAAPPGFNDPLDQYKFNRSQTSFSPNFNWYTLGRVPAPLQFFDNPSGSFTRMATGGQVGPSSRALLKQRTRPTTGRGRQKRSIMNQMAGSGPTKGGRSFIPGDSGGQDDDKPILASSGEYVIDATTVADLGDGNSAAGAKKLDEMRGRIAKDKGRSKVVPKKAKKPEQYLRRG
jgi:hypothetical protein